MTLETFISTHPFLFLIFISFIINFFVILLTKIFTNQKHLKYLKDEMKKIQDEMKNTKDAKQISKLNEKLLSLNSEYMKHTMHINLYTFLPIVLIFSWLSNIYAGLPFEPNTTVDLTVISKVENISLTVPQGLELIRSTHNGNRYVFTIKSEKEGIYNLTINPCGDKLTLISSHQLTNKTKQKQSINSRCIKQVFISYRPLKFNLFVIKLNWFWTYLILSFLFSSLLRKLLRVY